MYLKCDEETAEKVTGNYTVERVFLRKRRYGKHTYFQFIPNTTVREIAIDLNALMFNTNAEIVLVHDEEAHRMGIDG